MLQRVMERFGVAFNRHRRGVVLATELVNLGLATFEILTAIAGAWFLGLYIKCPKLSNVSFTSHCKGLVLATSVCLWW